MPHDEGGAVVLFADDEPVIRNFVQLALAKQGYHVMAASNGFEALQLSRAFHGSIDLLLSDVKMPGMTGIELAKIIKEERPNIRVLLITGHSSGSIPDHLRRSLLRKPFLPQVLVAKIRELLASGPTDEPHIIGD